MAEVSVAQSLVGVAVSVFTLGGVHKSLDGGVSRFFA